MSEETSQVPAPEPLPVAPSPGRKTPWLLVAGIVLVALSVLGVLAYFIGTFLWGDPGDGLVDGGLEYRVSMEYYVTPASAWFSGDGRYVVAQYVDPSDRPGVRIQPLEGGKARTIEGYRVVGVEKTGARIWLVPDAGPVGLDSSKETTPRIMDIAGDGIDGPPSELYVLDLDSEGKPRSDLDARWKLWKGPGRFTASVEIDVNKGSVPATLRFGDAASHLNVWQAKVPTDVVTFEPIGWSPSGEYLAVLSQARVSDVAGRVSAEASPTAEGEVRLDEVAEMSAQQTTATLLVFSASDGKVVSRTDLPISVLSANSSAVAAWEVPAGSGAASDVLVYLAPDRGDDGEYATDDLLAAWALTPGMAAKRLVSDEDWWGSGSTWIAGVDDKGVLIASQAELDSIATRRVQGDALGATVEIDGDVTAMWLPGRGLLTVRSTEMVDEKRAWSTYLAPDLGASTRRLFVLDGPPAY